VLRPPATASRSTSSSSTEDPVLGDRPDDGPLLEVGRIAKAHGLNGEVNVALVTDRTERLDPGSVLQTDRGPLEVLSSRRHQDRWLVRFRGHEDRTSAEQLRGLVLLAEPLDDPDELWVHELVGCRVVSSDGVDRGTVEGVQDNPAADLLVLDSGALVPVVFVVDGPTDGIVHVDVPDGLFELGD
jgi:16S rRNA processing protein RimM